MIVPQTAPMATTHTAMKNVMPAPWSTREKMSRPKLSVPMMCGKTFSPRAMRCCSFLEYSNGAMGLPETSCCV